MTRDDLAKFFAAHVFDQRSEKKAQRNVEIHISEAQLAQLFEQFAKLIVFHGVKP